jgi:hypothetical protein
MNKRKGPSAGLPAAPVPTASLPLSGNTLPADTPSSIATALLANVGLANLAAAQQEVSYLVDVSSRTAIKLWGFGWRLHEGLLRLTMPGRSRGLPPERGALVVLSSPARMAWA